jgi:hypothetical protein
MRFWASAAHNSNNNHQNVFLKLLSSSTLAISYSFLRLKQRKNSIIFAKSPNLPNSKKCTMPVFTSAELFKSSYVSYRIGNVNISIGAKGDNRRSFIR